METTVQLRTWGHSLGMVVPKAACEALGLKPGQDLNVTVRDGALVAKPQVQRFQRAGKATVEELFDGWTGTYEPPADWPAIGNEIDWGAPAGREIW